MARLQILELPEGADDNRPPFVLVIDEAATGPDGLPRPGYREQRDLAEAIGAQAVLVFEDTIDIPANDTSAYAATLHETEWTEADRAQARVSEEVAKVARGAGTNIRDKDAELRAANEWIDRLSGELKEARQWARHGYEIGQKHCGWSDHGVAPDWLTEGWPRHIDSCDHLKRATGLDEAVARVRATPNEPECMNANQEHPGVWKHGYGIGVRAAKAALTAHNEPTSEPTYG